MKLRDQRLTKMNIAGKRQLLSSSGILDMIYLSLGSIFPRNADRQALAPATNWGERGRYISTSVHHMPY